MSDFRISLVQSDLFWEDIEANLQQFDEKLLSLKGKTDLVILPEMFTTGFSMNAEVLAEEMTGETVQWMTRQAREIGAAILGSCIIKDGEDYFNRLLFVEPDGSIQSYDKRHLFSFAGEGAHFTAGNDRLIIQYKGLKIKPLVCYDLRFPVWSRNVEDYDLLVYVANFPAKRSFAWKQLLIARSIENQSFTVGLNRVGVDGKDIDYSGDSCLLDYAGGTIMDLKDKDTVETFAISIDKQNEFRKQFAFLQDRDSFDLKPAE